MLRTLMQGFFGKGLLVLALVVVLVLAKGTYPDMAGAGAPEGSPACQWVNTVGHFLTDTSHEHYVPLDNAPRGQNFAIYKWDEYGYGFAEGEKLVFEAASRTGTLAVWARQGGSNLFDPTRTFLPGDILERDIPFAWTTTAPGTFSIDVMRTSGDQGISKLTVTCEVG